MAKKQSEFDVLGYSGLKEWGGKIYEEFHRRLQGGYAAKVYREMADNSSTIGAVRYLIKALVRQVEWRIEPSIEGDEQSIEWASFVETCMEDMDTSFEDFISEVLSFLDYGWAYFETVYKIRGGRTKDPKTKSKYSDGKIGWRKFALRAQDTLDAWQFSKNDQTLEGMHQQTETGQVAFIPIDKAILFRTETYKDNPEGRALTLDTPIPTPNGWVNMKNICVGDKVYDEAGKIRYVTWKSDVFENRPTYEIKFSTGESIRADGNHLWSITTGNDRYNDKEPRQLTTEQMYERMQENKGNPHYCCGRAPTLDSIHIPLPLDPYLLGYWLGNGVIGKSAFSTGEEDRPFIQEQLQRADFESKLHGTTNILIKGGLLSGLRNAGVLDKKHIPQAYMRASTEQRLSLLQGLMDSDGYSPKEDAKDIASWFHNTNKDLIDGVAELVRSLGGVPSIKLCMKAGRNGGCIDGKQIVAKKDVYNVRFILDKPVHKLPRKLERQRIRESGHFFNHHIESIERVEDSDTVCIEVDAPSHMFLAGNCMVPTHNSIYRNAVVDWFFLKRISEIEAIGIERDLTGLPVMQVPVSILSTDATAAEQALRTQFETLLSQIKRDERAYAMVPSELNSEGKPTGYKFSLLSSGGQHQVDTDKTKTYYKIGILQSVVAQFLQLGLSNVGSFALASSQTNLFAVALGAYLDTMVSTFNRSAIGKLMELNGVDAELWPKLVHGDIESPPLAEIAAYIQALAMSGQLPEDDAIKRKLLEIGGLPIPELDEGQGVPPKAKAPIRSLSAVQTDK